MQELIRVKQQIRNGCFETNSSSSHSFIQYNMEVLPFYDILCTDKNIIEDLTDVNLIQSKVSILFDVNVSESMYNFLYDFGNDNYCTLVGDIIHNLPYKITVETQIKLRELNIEVTPINDEIFGLQIGNDKWIIKLIPFYKVDIEESEQISCIEIMLLEEFNSQMKQIMSNFDNFTKK